MDKIKVKEVYLRNKLQELLLDMKLLNGMKVDRDVKRINNGEDLKEIFVNNNELDELGLKLETKKTEMNILIGCLINGFDFLDNILNHFSSIMDEEEFKMTEEFINRIKVGMEQFVEESEDVN